MAQQELDSFFVKFKCLLQSEKDATLTLKSEAGRAFVTLSLDLGHVRSEQDLPPRVGGLRNGPARMRRRERRAAAREKLATEEAIQNVESTADVEKTKTVEKPAAEEAKGILRAADNVAKTKDDEKPSDTEQVEAEIKARAAKATELCEEMTAAKVEEVVDDEFCTDDVYNFKQKETKSVQSQTLESGPLPTTPSKPGFDYFSLTYDDLSD